MSQPPLIIRPAAPDDMRDITAIYALAVKHGTASFEVDPPDLAEMRKRRAAVLELGLPYLVAEKEGRLLGYAYAGWPAAMPADSSASCMASVAPTASTLNSCAEIPSCAAPKPGPNTAIRAGSIS